MRHSDHHTYVCPDCAASFPVDAATRDALLAHGCAVCGSPVSTGAFSPYTDRSI